jgi:hypothetical protein
MENQDLTDLMIRLDVRTERMDRELFGNGQPGKIAELEGGVAGCKSFQRAAIAACAALAFVATVSAALAAWVK